ncbi:MAG: DUF948 domain-containing protein [Ignavibacteriae bacterium]|nr:DUF948 domain-containing protein [Ignavibacteriota bacterium]MCB9215269.1 DUF948 domain-containing protein [Ignavibacteria bacterium]
MADILYIAGAVALLALAGLFVYLIFFMKEAKMLIANASNTLSGLSTQVEAQLQNVDGIVKNVEKLTDDLTEVVDDATDVIHEGRNVVVSLLELEQTLQQSVQEPIIEAVSILSALGKGIRAFRFKLANKIDSSAELNGVPQHYHLQSEVDEL